MHVQPNERDSFPQLWSSADAGEFLFRGRSLALLVAGALTLCHCQAELSHNLDEGTANRIVTTLAQEGIPASAQLSRGRGPRRWTVIVPRAEVARARQLLLDANLPPPPKPGLAETYAQPGLLPSPLEEEARLVRALQGELAATLESVEGVLAARVHVSINQGRLQPNPGASGPRPTASVLLRYRGAPPPIAASEVQGLVAGAVAGLEPADVTVVAQSHHPRQSPVRVAEHLVPLGPFAVSPASAVPLRTWLAVSASLVGILGLAVVFLVLRLRVSHHHRSG